MKKNTLYFVLGITVFAMTGLVNASAEEAENGLALIEDSEAAEFVADFDPADYLVADAAQYVEIGDLNELSAERYVYQITEEAIDDRISQEMSYYGEEKEVDRPADYNDLIYGVVTSALQSTGEQDVDDDFVTSIGDEFYGPDFDEQLLGAKAGDKLSFTVTFPEDDYTDWAGETVDFTVEVEKVSTYEVPELTDAFIQENFGYTDIAEYKSSIKGVMEAEYDEQSFSEAAEAILTSAIDSSTFSGYPQDLFDTSKDEFIEYFSSFLGSTSVEDLCSAFGITEEELDSEILLTVNRALFVSAYSQANNITVTAEEYEEALSGEAAYYGYNNIAEFEEAYGRASYVQYIYETKVKDALYETAKIIDITVDSSLMFEDMFDEPYEDETDFEGSFEMDDDEFADDGQIYDADNGTYLSAEDFEEAESEN